MKHRPKLTYANVVSSLALFLALGGVSWAAATLPNDSVGNAQIKDGAVDSSKVKDRSLMSADFKSGQIPAGPRGLAGLQGPRGITGLTGLQGPKGDAGLTGPQGPKGDQGSKGDQGLKGDSGSVGDTGPRGPTGATGPSDAWVGTSAASGYGYGVSSLSRTLTSLSAGDYLVMVTANGASVNNTYPSESNCSITTDAGTVSADGFTWTASETGSGGAVIYSIGSGTGAATLNEGANLTVSCTASGSMNLKWLRVVALKVGSLHLQ